jgi:hypothetical protein
MTSGARQSPQLRVSKQVLITRQSAVGIASNRRLVYSLVAYGRSRPNFTLRRDVKHWQHLINSIGY